jgi:hypothetical protein
MTPTEPEPFYKPQDEAHVTNRGIADHAVQGRANAMRPSDSPDYQRIVTITQEIEAGEGRGETSRDQINSVCEFSTAMGRAIDRATAVLRGKREVPPHRQIITHLTNVWCEAFMSGIIFIEHGGHRDGHDFPLDRMRLADITMELEELFMDRNIESEYSKHVDLYALAYVGAVKADKYWHLSGEHFASVFDMHAPTIGIWLEGFYYGARFKQLGGHRVA